MAEIVFLDRDGVINRFPGKGAYVVRQEEFFFLPRAIEAIRCLTEAGKEIVVISNQGCVSRGMITQPALETMTRRMLEAVEQGGGRIQKVLYCYHQKADACDCKKPKTKLFLQAIGGRPVDLNNTFFIGDSEEDIQAAKNLGCKSVLVLSGRTTPGDLGEFPVKPDVIQDDLWGAVQWILKKRS